MPNLKFILSLEKDSLNQMRLELLNINSKKHIKAQDMTLSRVTFDEFCCAMLDLVGTKDGKSHTNLSTEELLSFIRIFSIFYDSVDVDSRGIIQFTDFSNFCLRVGRNQFKPSIKRSIASYNQDLNNSPAFPIGRLCFIPQTRLLYTFDSDTPVVRLFRRDGRFVGKVNPVALLKRSLKLNAMTGSMTYHDKKQFGKDYIKAKNAERELNATKGTVNAMVYIDSTKQWMFANSTGYLIWFGTPAGGFKTEEDLTMVSYIKTTHPQIGMIYSKALDLVLTWSGDGSDHMFEVWDPHHRALRLRIQRHEKKILSVCEVTLDPLHPLSAHFFASSCIDGKNLMWSTTPISALTHKSSKMLRVADPLVFELRGNEHATRSIIYAPDHELIFGAGFDFEVYVWDPHTRDIVMRLVGHFKPLYAITLVFSPNEKVATIDVGGTIKIWNVDKEQGLFGEQVQSLQLQCPLPLTIFDFTAAFNGGNTIAVLAERLYMISIEPESIDNIRPVAKGVGYCEGASRMWCITRNAINVVNLSDGTVIKRVAFLDQDRVSSEDVIAINPEHKQKVDDAAETEEEKLDKALNIAHYKTSYIDQKDTITAVSLDARGKKLFLGSMDGRIFIFDTFTFGLLVQLTNALEDPNFIHQGSVAGLWYVDRDELLIAAYSNGAVKVLVGCHRTNSNKGNTQTGNKGLTEEGEVDYFSQSYPASDGGKPPSRPFLLRENDLGAINDNSICGVAFSESFNLIATCTKDSFIYVYDYINMDLLSVLRIPKFEDKSVNCIEIMFVPLAPMLLAIDHMGRISSWTVKPMKFKWINTWSAYYNIAYDDAGENTKWSTRGSMISGGIQPIMSVSVPVNVQLTCFKAFVWWDPNVDREAEKPPTPAPTSGLQRSNSVRQTLTHGVSFMAGSLDFGEGSISIPFNSDRQTFGSVSSVAIKEAAEAVARSFEGPGSSFISASPGGKSRPQTQRSLRRQATETKKLKNSIQQSSNHIWTLLIGDESGNMMCQNITRLVETSGAAFQNTKSGAKYPVYQRMKLKKRSYENRPPPPPDVQNMIAHPIGDFDKKDLVTHSRMNNSSRYVTGVRKWVAFHGDPVRVICPVDNSTYEKYKETGLFPELALSNFVAGANIANTSNKIDSAIPVAVFTASEYGNVRLWSWDGQCLGQLKEEELTLHQQAIKLAEQAPKAEKAVEEDHTFDANTVYVTSVIEEKPVVLPPPVYPPGTVLPVFESLINVKPLPARRRVSVIRKSDIGRAIKKATEITTKDMSALVLGMKTSFTACELAQEGWSFPSVTMKTYDNYTSDATAAQAATERISRYTINQFNFFSCVMSWVLPYINRYVDRMNEEIVHSAGIQSPDHVTRSSLFITESNVEIVSPVAKKPQATSFVPFSGAKINTNTPFSPVKESEPDDLTIQIKPTTPPAKLDKKFGSTANLLQGLNTLLVRKNTMMLDEATMLKPIISSPTMGTIMEPQKSTKDLTGKTTPAAAKSTAKEGTRKPSDGRSSPYRPNDSLASPSRLSQKEAEAARLASDEADGEYLKSLSEMNMVNELEESALLKKQNKKNLVGLIDYIQKNDYFAELKYQASSSLKFKNMEEVNFSKRKDKILLDIFEDPAYADLKPKEVSNLVVDINAQRRNSVSPLGVRRNSTTTSPSLPASPQPLQIETIEQTQSPPLKRPSSTYTSPAKTPAQHRRDSMSRLTRPKSANVIPRPTPTNNLDGNDPTEHVAKVLLRNQTKMDNILNLFDSEGEGRVNTEVIQVTRSFSSNNNELFETRNAVSQTLSRPASAPTISPHSPLEKTDSFESGGEIDFSFMHSPKESHHCQSQRCLEISNKFQETIKSEANRQKYAMFDPLHELKQKRRMRAQKTIENHKNNNNELKEYIDLKTHDFEGVVNVGKELELQQIKANKAILEQDESAPKLYGPYSPSDIFGYLNLTYQLEPLTKVELEKMDAAQYNITNDYRDPFSGQQVYATDYLLKHKLIATYPTILASLKQTTELSGSKTVTDSDLIIMIFQHAAIDAHIRIFLFVRVARMTYTLMQNAVPPREGISLIHKKTNTATTATAASLESLPATLATVPSPKANPAATLSSTLDDANRRKSAIAPKNNIHIGHKYVVKPHQKRGFRKWAIKHKDMRRFAKFFDLWTIEGNDAMLICEFVDIIQSVVPKLELQYYRILTTLGPAMNRIEYRLTTELSSEVIMRIYENIFEVKIVPG